MAHTRASGGAEQDAAAGGGATTTSSPVQDRSLSALHDSTHGLHQNDARSMGKRARVGAVD
jgi:hypothetical protein